MNKHKWQAGFVNERSDLRVGLSFSPDVLYLRGRDNLNCFSVPSGSVTCNLKVPCYQQQNLPFLLGFFECSVWCVLNCSLQWYWNMTGSTDTLGKEWCWNARVVCLFAACLPCALCFQNWTPVFFHRILRFFFSFLSFYFLGMLSKKSEWDERKERLSKTEQIQLASVCSSEKTDILLKWMINCLCIISKSSVRLMRILKKYI